MKSLRYFVPQLGSLATYPSPPLAIDLSHSVQAVEFRFFPNREREIFAAARSRSSSKDYNSIRDRQNSGKLESYWGVSGKTYVGHLLGARSEHCPTSLIGFLSVHHGVVGIKVGLRRAGTLDAKGYGSRSRDQSVSSR
ncbi:hypothetical protein L1987_89329 [Smallanthus sonchifolius]|nr:hypothetical protein L1987_89329 [Smallanthus sonchifolius]